MGNREKDMSISLISLNCEGHKHLARIVPFLQQQRADMICLQEIFQHDLPLLEQELGVSAVFLPLANVIHPNNYGIDPLGEWGLALLTALPTPNVQKECYVGNSAQPIPEFRNGEPNSINRAVLSATVEKDGQSFSIATTHFTWTNNGDADDRQRGDLQKLFAVLANHPEFVLTGDFNAPRGGEIFAKIAARYTDNISAGITSSLDPNLHRVGYKQLMVDGLFTTLQYQASEVQVVSGVSDHCAIVAKINKH